MRVKLQRLGIAIAAALVTVALGAAAAQGQNAIHKSSQVSAKLFIMGNLPLATGKVTAPPACTKDRKVVVNEIAPTPRKLGTVKTNESGRWKLTAVKDATSIQAKALFGGKADIFCDPAMSPVAMGQ